MFVYHGLVVLTMVCLCFSLIRCFLHREHTLILMEASTKAISNRISVTVQASLQMRKESNFEKNGERESALSTKSLIRIRETERIIMTNCRL